MSVEKTLNPHNLIRYLQGAEMRTAQRCLIKARQKSMGKYSRKELRKMGFPYAVRHEFSRIQGLSAPRIPYGDPGMINIQSGDFIMSWELHYGGGTNTITTQVTNTSPHADALAKGIEGLTIARPLMRDVVKVAEYWRIPNLSRGIRNAIKSM